MHQGDIVQILAMPSGVVKGLPDDEVDFLMESVGDVATVCSVGGNRTFEVVISRDTRVYSVWMNASDLEIASPMWGLVR